ncbi:hypothetical protein D8I24_2925 [Cupriavidus necator H850]|uniref:alpha/beta hydrolase n=1 Tax=Cupriavidus necator TaxID=106590 RepID=UPI00129D4654|nr:alpha/beta hydrolase [Cupriavidus necator]KAI3603362.1 hypothetical protein D8I24_2925 [Cupriavidus necator H850]
MALDSHSIAFLEGLGSSGAKPLHQMKVDEARQFMAGLREIIGPGPEMLSVREEHLPCESGSFRVRALVPSQSPDGIIVYCHGGGWVLMSIDDYDTLARRLAVETNCTVVLVDYRLAPEHPFPAALDDVWQAVVWTERNRVALASGNSVPLIIMGDSAGGNLAAVVAQRSRGVVEIAQQILIYPVTSDDTDSACYHAAENQCLLGTADMRWFWELYLSDATSRRLPDASPINAQDLRGLPPAVVVTAEHDILRDDGEAYVAAMREAGVRVDHRRFEGQMHGFFSMDRLLPVSAQARAYVASYVERRLGELNKAAC